MNKKSILKFVYPFNDLPDLFDKEYLCKNFQNKSIYDAFKTNDWMSLRFIISGVDLYFIKLSYTHLKINISTKQAVNLVFDKKFRYNFCPLLDITKDKDLINYKGNIIEHFVKNAIKSEFFPLINLKTI